MAIAFLGIQMDTPHYKEFFLTTIESDAINAAEAAMTFGAGGMSNFTGTPTVYWAVEVTATGDAPTAPCNLALHTVTNLGFTANNASEAGAAIVHTWRVYMTDKQLYEI